MPVGGGERRADRRGRFDYGNAMSEPALRVVDLTKRYRSAPAVDAVSFAVESGETVALLGGNGAGKTTILGMLLGLVAPSSGRIAALGCNMRRRPRGALARMNFSSPYVDMPHRLTVRENFSVFARLYALDNAGARTAALARELGFEDLLDRPVGTLSAGQKTRASLARALLNRPDLLLLDEPTASLDPDTADIVRTALEAYRERTGAAILLASHNMAEVERLCDRAIVLKAGRTVACGAPAALIARYGRRDLEEVFLDIARGRAA